jgi:hypothetical protein
MNYSDNHNSKTEAEKYRVNRSLEVAANSLYNKVSQRGLLAGLKRLFGGKKVSSLYALDEVKRQIRVQGHEAVGEMTIDLDMILGTTADGRAQDFDVDFRPTQTHNKERWLGVAAAWIGGRRLGRVKLVQVDDIFFVEDGHHRISVAKAMGEQAIEAVVVRILGSGTLTAPVASEQKPAGIDGTLVPVLA